MPGCWSAIGRKNISLPGRIHATTEMVADLHILGGTLRTFD